MSDILLQHVFRPLYFAGDKPLVSFLIVWVVFLLADLTLSRISRRRAITWLVRFGHAFFLTSIYTMANPFLLRKRWLWYQDDAKSILLLTLVAGSVFFFALSIRVGMMFGVRHAPDRLWRLRAGDVLLYGFGGLFGAAVLVHSAFRLYMAVTSHISQHSNAMILRSMIMPTAIIALFTIMLMGRRYVPKLFNIGIAVLLVFQGIAYLINVYALERADQFSSLDIPNLAMVVGLIFAAFLRRQECRQKTDTSTACADDDACIGLS